MPVIDASATEIRVVAEQDDARLALWIDRRDTWPTLRVPVQLADREGRVPRDAGAWIATGAPIDVAYGNARMRHVTLRDPDVAVDGWVPSSAIDNVWIATPTEKRPRDRRPRTWFVEHATIRAAPDASAPIVAGVLANHVVGFVAARGPWTEVEVLRPYARLRGFVRARELVDAGAPPPSGTAGGHGFGVTHFDRIVVPAGTCLFDAANGEVVGVQSAASERDGERGGDGWSRVFVDSPWAVLEVFVHDTGGDPKQPVWESCARR